MDLMSVIGYSNDRISSLFLIATRLTCCLLCYCYIFNPIAKPRKTNRTGNNKQRKIERNTVTIEFHYFCVQQPAEPDSNKNKHGNQTKRKSKQVPPLSLFGYFPNVLIVTTWGKKESWETEKLNLLLNRVYDSYWGSRTNSCWIRPADGCHDSRSLSLSSRVYFFTMLGLLRAHRGSCRSREMYTHKRRERVRLAGLCRLSRPWHEEVILRIRRANRFAFLLAASFPSSCLVHTMCCISIGCRYTTAALIFPGVVSCLRSILPRRAV